MNAKQRLIEFLKSAKANPHTPYTFTLDMPPENARTYIHRMRVELTRLRTALRERGERIKPFKMIVEEIIQDSLEPNQTHVTLYYKTNTELSKVHRDISEVFELITVPGEKQLPAEVRNV